MTQRHFGNRSAAIEDRSQQIFVLRRIDPVVPAGQHRDRAAVEAGAVRRLIDAACQARGDDKTGLTEIMCQLAGEFQPGAGRVARAHDRDHRPHQRLDRAAHAEQRRGIVERRKPWRIAGFAGRDQADALSLAGGEFGAGIVLAADTALTRRATPPRQIG